MQLLDRAETLPEDSRAICLCWNKLSGDTEFEKDLLNQDLCHPLQWPYDGKANAKMRVFLVDHGERLCRLCQKVP